jgi:hypothetical protein
MIRPYTGFDGVAAGEHPQLGALLRQLFKHYDALWNNGAFMVRNIRGKSTRSVHSTGRAVDVSWRNMGDGKRGKPKGGRKQAMAAMEYLRKNADALGVELIIDYFPAPHGRAARCDRNMSWKRYEKPTVLGAPRGDWFHLEVDGKKSVPWINEFVAANPPDVVV